MTSNEDLGRELSTGFPPIPYIPQLCRVLGGVTIAVVFTYLEIHHSPPEPHPAAQPAHAGLRMPPVALDCDQACDDLGVSRRTLNIALEGLSVWWGSEAKRSMASRAGRDFFATSPSFSVLAPTSIRPYACVGSRAFQFPRTIAIHRNPQRIRQILVNSGLISTPQTTNELLPETETAVTSRSTDTVPAILESALGLSPQKRGLAWGWSQERVREHSARMTRLWAERRENGLVGGSRRG